MIKKLKTFYKIQKASIKEIDPKIIAKVKKEISGKSAEEIKTALKEAIKKRNLAPRAKDDFTKISK